VGAVLAGSGEVSGSGRRDGGRDGTTSGRTGLLDRATVEGFGREWAAFDQSALADDELRRMFDAYFAIFPWPSLPPDAAGVDIGCGSGRWARFVAPRVGHVTCLDASEEAVAVARRALAGTPNVDVRVGVAGALAFPAHTFDFGYAIGVLHHIPDVERALRDCVRVLKPGAPLLVYLYYALDGRPRWYRCAWRASDRLRCRLCRRSFRTRSRVSSCVAALVYWPLARVARAVSRVSPRRAERLPLALYRDKPFYVMRNDALDRLGTAVEHRFARAELERMLERAGLHDIAFSPRPPYWVAVGRAAAG
jgi:SAM-dependent methyltransferase